MSNSPRVSLGVVRFPNRTTVAGVVFFLYTLPKIRRVCSDYFFLPPSSQGCHVSGRYSLSSTARRSDPFFAICVTGRRQALLGRSMEKILRGVYPGDYSRRAAFTLFNWDSHSPSQSLRKPVCMTRISKVRILRHSSACGAKRPDERVSASVANQRDQTIDLHQHRNQTDSSLSIPIKLPTWSRSSVRQVAESVDFSSRRVSTDLASWARRS